MVRLGLKNLNNARRVFRGTFQGFSRKHMRQEFEWTLILKNITDKDGNVLTDHLWFNLNKEFDKLNLKDGDRVEFSARVVEYVKGRKNVSKKNKEIDYKLDLIKGIRKLPSDEKSDEN
jgi:hypothetical protein